MYNGKSRHIHHRQNTLRQLLSIEVISLNYVKSMGKIVNPLAKRLKRDLVEKLLRGMRLKPIKE